VQGNDGGAGMNSEPTRRRSSAPWVAVSMTAGAAFAIVALLNAYVIVAILAGLAYSLVTMVNRRRL
jgi:hypothetical protein